MSILGKCCTDVPNGVHIPGNAPREAVSFDGEEWAEDTDYDPGETADGEKYFDDKWGEDLNEESDFAGDSSKRIGTDREIGKDWKILERWFWVSEF